MKKASNDREPNDYYPTPAFVVEELLKRETFEGGIWECAAGEGAISDVLKQHGYEVYSSDLIDRGYGELLDFLESNYIVPNIVTNPPFKLALEFVEHAKNHATKKIALFLPLTFLESQRRYEMFQDTAFPLKCIYQFSKRVSLYKGGIKLKNSGMVAFAWFVWDIDWEGEPIIKWINTDKNEKIS